VSYFEVAINDGERVKSKNAGLCASTGTGSTSWSYNISKISPQTVEALCDIMSREEGIDVTRVNKMMIDRVTREYNNDLIFHPGKANDSH